MKYALEIGATYYQEEVWWFTGVVI